MEVYLTFDDGIQDGTEEVLSVLKETGVKATFFLIGIELHYAYKKAPEKCLGLMREIYENHAIGNHTYSHTHDLYADYYLNDGVVIDKSGGRMSILKDFSKGKDQINHYLKMISNEAINEDYPLAKNQKRPLARFPGRNNWYIPNPLLPQSSGNSQKYLEYSEPGTEGKAKQLFDAGYHVFGWTAEWKMTFDFHHEAIAKKQQIQQTRGIDYSNEDDVHSGFDMAEDQNLGKDRLTESWTTVSEKILGAGAVQNKVVLLMHDRAFRKGFAFYDKSKQINTDIDRSTASERDKLRSLINHLKNLNVEFKTLDLLDPSV